MALAHVAGVDTSIHGSLDGRVPREGDLRPGELRAILAAWNDRSPGAPAAHGGSPGAALADEADDDRPPREDHCAGCPFPAIVDAVRAAAVETGGEPLLVGDPGCLVKAVDRLHAKFAMGSAAAVVQGLRHGGVDRPVVALFGDSAFFHTAIPAIINAVQHAVDVLFVVLDNAATVTSGFQPNPGTGRDARGRESPSLSITRIASACGVELVRVVEEGGDVGAPVREGLEHPGPALVVVRSRCERSERTE